MPELYYEDLLTVPFKPMGRSIKEGMDCYGLCIELCRRVGKKLKDIPYSWENHDLGTLDENLLFVNGVEIPNPEQYAILQTDYFGELHTGFMLNSERVIHMTKKGVMLYHLSAFKKKKFFRVLE